MSEQKNTGDATERDEMEPDTLLAHAGRNPQEYHGFINPPLVRASTVLFPDVESMQGCGDRRYSYGLTNTPTIEALTGAVDALELSAGTVLLPSGLAAVTLPVLAFAEPGTRFLVPDNVYWPTRRFCDESLNHLGVETVYYDPMIGAGISDMFGSGKTILALEAPGSQTFEVPDLEAMIAAARAANVITMMDNTWATPLIYKPVAHGIDISIHAGTKYLAGHSDLLIGTVSAGEDAWPRLKAFHRNCGMQAGTEEIWLTLRGMRTMGVRLERHEKNAMEVAQWLADRPEVQRVLHPALPSCPGHQFWQRDFGRSIGLFACEMDGSAEQAMSFLNTLRLFGLGYSWGGFESLAVLADLSTCRTARPWTGGPVVRLHVGLEDTRDLIADLERGFAATRTA